ncbi:hypothetical protein AAZV13_07G219800 [Glycine max]
MLHIYYIFHNGNLSSCPNNPFLPLFTVVFFILPIEKDPATLQYSTSIDMGTPPLTLDLVIDIRERFLWFECSNHSNSSTHHPFRCGTNKCMQASQGHCLHYLHQPHS